MNLEKDRPKQLAHSIHDGYDLYAIIEAAKGAARSTSTDADLWSVAIYAYAAGFQRGKNYVHNRQRPSRSRSKAHQKVI